MLELYYTKLKTVTGGVFRHSRRQQIAVQSIWETNNLPKYNDYVNYNTISGDKEEDVNPDKPSI